MPTAKEIYTNSQTTETDKSLRNSDLINNPDPGFILSATIHKGQGDAHEIDVVISSFQHPVIVSPSLRDQFANGEQPINAFYFTREEVQTAGLKSNAHLTKIDQMLGTDYRLVRVMPVLMLHQEGKEMIPLTLRGLGASNKDNWGCASSLAGEAITIPSIYKTLNRETGILIDGRPAIFVPTADMVADNDAYDSEAQIRFISYDAEKAKLQMAKRVPELRRAFARSQDVLTLEAGLQLPANSNVVHIHGGLMNTDLKCVAYDNPPQRTLTLVFPMVAKIPDNVNLTVFNGEGYPGPATLATKQELRGNCAGIPLIPGLREYIKG